MHALPCSTPTRGLASLSRTPGRMLTLVSHAARSSCPSYRTSHVRLLHRCCCHSLPRWPPPPRDRMPHTAAVSQSLRSRLAADPQDLLVAGRTLVPHTARSSRPPRAAHRICCHWSPRLATSPRDRTPHAARDRTPHAARRTARPAQSHHGHVSARYATVSTVRHHGLCPKACAVHRMVSTVRPRAAARTHAHDQHQSHTGRSHTRYVWSGRACTAEDLWKRVCLTAD